MFYNSVIATPLLIVVGILSGEYMRATSFKFYSDPAFQVRIALLASLWCGYTLLLFCCANTHTHTLTRF
jgi:hypothetical protein